MKKKKKKYVCIHSPESLRYQKELNAAHGTLCKHRQNYYAFYGLF